MSLHQHMLSRSTEVNPRWLIVPLMLLMLVVVPIGTAAPVSDVAYLDNFSVTRNGTTIFNEAHIGF